MATVTKPMALDETLQATNTSLTSQNSKLDTVNTKLQAIVDAIGSSSLIGDTDISGIADGTITGAIAGLNSGKVDKTSLGANNGVAQLDATGKVPSSQLPSFVDDVLEYASVSAFPATGESGKIYVALDTNLTYRWGGSAYVEISPSLALGETSSTAYRGDRGKIAYDHSQDANRVTTATAVGLYKVGATSEGHISGLTPIQKSDLTGLGLVGSVTDSTTNGNIVVDGVEIQAYDDTDVQNDIDAIEDELSTDYATVEGNPINFSTKSAQNAKSTILSVEPIQDLHGYSKPWVGGAGKNLLPMTVEGIKSVNTSVTWNENTTVINGVTLTILTDKDGNVTGIKTNGTSSGQITFNLLISVGYAQNIYKGMKFNGCTGGMSTTYCLMLTYSSNGSGWAKEEYQRDTDDLTVRTDYDYIRINILIRQNVQVSNVIFYPMIRLSTETDATFEPYTNICPISGRSEIGILGCGKNLLPKDYELTDRNGITHSVNDDGTFILTGTTTSKPYYAYIRSISNPLPVEYGQNYVVSFLKNDTLMPNISKVHARVVKVKNGVQGSDMNANNGIVSFTVDDSFDSIFIYINAEDTGIDMSGTYAIQLEVGTSNTPYSPYTESNDLTISFGQTVYGGTLDVENGVLVVDRDIGGVNNTWIYSTYGGKNYITKEFNDIYVDQQQSSYFPISSMCEFDRYGGAAYFVDGKMYQNNKDLYIQDSNYTTKESFISAYSDCQIVYYLATPIIINLTPHTIKLLEGVNNISVDDSGATITLTYRDGSVATLGDLTSAVDNLDSKIDESKILTDTATGDKYVLVVTNGVLSVEQISN